MHKKILVILCILSLFAAIASAQEKRLGVAMGGGVGVLAWENTFVNSLEAAGFGKPGLAYNFYGGSEFILNEKWLLRNLGQGIVYHAEQDGKQTKLTVGIWTLSALRLWEVRPNLELGLGGLAGVGACSLRLDYGEPTGLEPNIRELTDKPFVSLAPIGTIRYRVGTQTLTMEALYLKPFLLKENEMKSGWQVQVGLSYDLGY